MATLPGHGKASGLTSAWILIDVPERAEIGKEPHLQGSRLRSGKMEDSETASNQHLSVNTDLEAFVRALQAENEQLKLQNREIEGKLEVLEGAYKESIHLEGLLMTAPTDAELSHL